MSSGVDKLFTPEQAAKAEVETALPDRPGQEPGRAKPKPVDPAVRKKLLERLREGGDKMKELVK